jgi:hypothetical protein
MGVKERLMVLKGERERKKSDVGESEEKTDWFKQRLSSVEGKGRPVSLDPAGEETKGSPVLLRQRSEIN